MRRISSVLLFSFVGVLSLAGQNLIKPKQIAPDTLNRIIIMTDTITEVDTVFREFKYYSIDSLVRQIVNDSLGIDSLWKKDGTYSLIQNYSPNNNFLFGTNVGNTLTTGSGNIVFGNSGAALTTGSNNFLVGTNNLTASTGSTNLTIIGSDNLFTTNAATIRNTSIFGGDNFELATGVFDGNLINGTGNALYYSGALSNVYNLINGRLNLQNNYGQYNIINGNQNLTIGYSTSSIINGNQLLGSATYSQNSIANASSSLTNTGLILNSIINGISLASNTTNVSNSLLVGNTLSNTTTGAISNSFNIGDQNSSSVARLNHSYIAGYRNNFLGTGNTDFSTVFGYESARSASSIAHSTVMGYRNFYATTSALTNVIAIGRENGYNAVDQSNSIYLGYRQGYTTGAANRLMIGMAQDDPLLSGHFTSDWIRVNGYFEVRDKTGTAGNIAAWDGDKLVDSGTSLASIGGDPDQTLSYNGATSDLTISGTGGNTIALPEMVAYPIGSTGYGYRPEISAALAGGEPLLITEGSGINIVDNGVGTGFSISATDASTTNELQTISKSGELVTLSDGGGSFSTHTIDLGTQIAIVQPGGTTSDVVVGDIDITVPGTSATSIIGRDVDGVITGVTLGSGLSLSSGTLSSTATSLWSTDGSNVFRSTGRVGVGGAEHPTYTFTANTGTIHTSGAIRGDDFYMTGGLFDATTSDGNSGDILTSTGTAVDWVSPAINLDPGIGGLLSGSGTFTSSTPTKINFTSSLSDGITASTVNEDLTIPATGYYRITANGIIAVEDDAVFNVYIYVNGSVARSYSLTQTAGNDARVISFNFIQSLTSGWAVDVRVAKTSGSSNVQASSWDLMAEFIKT